MSRALLLGALICGLLLSLGCGKHKYGQYDLDSSLSRYCIELRWGRYLKASEHVSPEMRPAFLQVWQEAAGRLDMQDLDVRNLLVADDGNSAQVTLALTYVDKRSLSVRTSLVDQVWKRTEYGWLATQVFRPEGGLVELPDEAEPKAPDSGEPGFGGG